MRCAASSTPCGPERVSAWKMASNGFAVETGQSLAPAIRVGETADVALAEQHGRVFAGRVTRTADALDPGTRTLLVEVDVNNADHSLLAGSFVQVDLSTNAMVSPVTVPANALLFNAGGTQIVARMLEKKQRN